MRIPLASVLVVLCLGLAGGNDPVLAEQSSVQRGGAQIRGSRPPSQGARAPDCSGVDRWPTSMAFVHLKDDEITDNAKLDFKKTRATRLASEEIKPGLFRQVHLVTFHGEVGQDYPSDHNQRRVE